MSISFLRSPCVHVSMHVWHLSHVLKFQIDRWILKKLRLRLPILKMELRLVQIGVSRAFFFKITIRLMPGRLSKAHANPCCKQANWNEKVLKSRLKYFFHNTYKKGVKNTWRWHSLFMFYMSRSPTWAVTQYIDILGEVVPHIRVLVHAQFRTLL